MILYTYRPSGQGGMFMPEKVLHCLVTREGEPGRNWGPGVTCKVRAQVTYFQPDPRKILEPPKPSTYEPVRNSSHSDCDSGNAPNARSSRPHQALRFPCLKPVVPVADVSEVCVREILRTQGHGCAAAALLTVAVLSVTMSL